MINFIDDIKKYGEVLENESLKKYNTYKVSGNLKVIVFPNSIEDLINIMRIIKKNKLGYKILGRGSNLIFYKSSYDMIFIKLDKLNNLEVNKNLVTVGAGYDMIKLSLYLAEKRLSGLEFASGIPGSIGGCIFMNAGAYKWDMSKVVVKVKALTPDLDIKMFSNDKLEFEYRNSFFKKNNDYIILECTFEMSKGNNIDSKKLIEERREKRFVSQPVDMPSAGSVFRNPIDIPAWKVIDECNLKGYRVGGAMVSNKHANFIVNDGKATGEDIKKLIKIIEDKVSKEKGINLILEQEIVD